MPKITFMSLGSHVSDGKEPSDTEKAHADQGGFALVFFALAIVALLGIAALVVDVGYWYLESAHMQRAADAAALGGVVYMPNDVPSAEAVALKLAQVNGFDGSQSKVTVTVTPNPHGNNPDQLGVSITDHNVPTFFAKIFGLDAISETRTSIAQYDPPVPLGSPENSLGTGNLTLGSAPAGVSPAPTCGGVNCANYWLGISGFCAAREDGDEFSTFYAGDRADGNTDCPDDTETASPNPSASTIFDNPDYRSTGYIYDIDVPSNGSTTNPVTPADVTVEIYDPAYNPPRETGSSLGSCTVTSPGSIPGDSATGWGTNGTCDDYTNSEVNTDWLLEAPAQGSSGSGTVIDPPHASTSDPGVFRSRDATCENGWCSVGTIAAGSTPGNYQLHLWTEANEPNSYGSNQFASAGRGGRRAGGGQRLRIPGFVPLMPAGSGGHDDVHAVLDHCRIRPDGRSHVPRGPRERCHEHLREFGRDRDLQSRCPPGAAATRRPRHQRRAVQHLLPGPSLPRLRGKEDRHRALRPRGGRHGHQDPPTGRRRRRLDRWDRRCLARQLHLPDLRQRRSQLPVSRKRER